MTDFIKTIKLPNNSTYNLKLTNPFAITINSPTTNTIIEGTNKYTFDGSTSKTLDIIAGNNINFTINSGTMSIAASDEVTYAKYLMNRGGSTISIGDSTWSAQFTPSGHTNRETIWNQKWARSGLTYTPTNGSATNLTDTANIKMWLSSSNTDNVLNVNMQIDGELWAHVLRSSNIQTTGDHQIQLTDFDGTSVSNGISTTRYPGFTIRDKNGIWTGAYRQNIYTDGSITTQITMRNYLTETNTWTDINVLSCHYYKNGTITYGVANAAAFRSAIGAGTSSLAIGITSTTAMAGNTTVTNVKQGTTVSSSWRKILLSGGDAYAAYNTDVGSDIDNQVYRAKSVSVQPSTGTIQAAAFIGSLTGSCSGSSSYIHRRQSFAKGTNPSSTQWYVIARNLQTGSGTAATDRFGGYIESSLDANGRTTLDLRSYTFASGVDTNNYIRICKAQNGTNSYEIADPAAFRNAIGASSDIWPVSLGGTGQTSVANIKAGKDGDGNTISSTYLKQSASTGSKLTNSLYINRAYNDNVAIRFGSIAGTGTDYTTIAQDDWGIIFCWLPAKTNSSGNYRSVGFTFREFSRNSNGTRTSYYEEFSLPSVAVSRTANASYSILTSKSTVTIAQGGTGATSASGARTNLSVPFYLYVNVSVNYTSSTANKTTACTELKALLEQITTGQVAVFRANANGIKIMSLNQVNSSYDAGLIVRTDTNYWRVLSFTGTRIDTWAITALTTTSITLSDIQQYVSGGL